ncbi:MAG: ABC transporter permease [Ruminococcus sp.]|nr:ABC transporter permease [Ruminococcus sp.]
MQTASFFKQTHVYFKKVTRISIREKAWIYLAFAVIIALIVNLVTASDMFENLDSTKSGFFTMASACIWIGVFNSIQSICKEHDIIRSEYRQGTKLSSYVCAHVLWQAVLCFVQSLIIFTVCLCFGFFGDSFDNGVIFHPLAEYFITVFLLTFGAAVLGLMVSSFSGTPTTAMKIMPFVLIIQLILSGVLFELTGLAEGAAVITFSKWGMAAFGSIGDLNTLEPKIASELADKIPNFDKSIVAVTDDAFQHEAGNLLASWGWCLGLTAVFVLIAILSLKLKNRDS